MQLIDAHCHLESPDFAACLPEVIAEAEAVGVRRMVTAACNPDQWSRSRAIAGAHPQVSFALGVHPWFAHRAYLPKLFDLDTTGAVAIGEIGLDATVESPTMAVQMEIFEAQLCLARSCDLPVIVHCRRAFDELLQVMKGVGPLPRGGVMHAFSGSVELALDLTRRGFLISMGRSLTYRPSRKRRVLLEKIFPDYLLLETDSPDMPPAGLEKPNVPANLRHVLRGAAALLGESEERVAQVTRFNTEEVFRLAP